jgi:hypothetical protein
MLFWAGPAHLGRVRRLGNVLQRAPVTALHRALEIRKQLGSYRRYLYGRISKRIIRKQRCKMKINLNGEVLVFSKSDEYRRDAQQAHVRAESAKMPQERNTLLEIERAFNRLAALEEWMESKGIASQLPQCHSADVPSLPQLGDIISSSIRIEP